MFLIDIAIYMVDNTPTTHTGIVPLTPHYLEGLNEEQMEAVQTTEGPLLVLAAAGTGKTRVITTRVAHILSQNLAASHQILAVTFTNKAANEIKKRANQLAHTNVNKMPFLGTFHSVCTSILRRHAERVDLRPNFDILDAEEATRLAKQTIEAFDIDIKKWPPRLLTHHIDQWKNNGFTPDTLPEKEGALFANGKGKPIYAFYQKRLKTLNACDFGDLLLECFRLFQENIDILQQYQDTIRYVMVDEYQDTNTIQYMWLRLLVNKSTHAQGPNICCVGDDDQSIYAWRGAQVQNILSFPQHFPNTKIIRLQRNYRSDAHILHAASHLISHNTQRHNKTLQPNGEDGEKVTVSEFYNDDAEARAICEDIYSAIKQNNISAEEIAILVRSASQMRILEEKLVLFSLDYRIIGGPRFYERAEIRDAIAYLKVISNPSLDIALERIINVPARGIGKKSLQRMQHYAHNQGISLYEAAIKFIETDEISGKARAGLTHLLRYMQTWTKAKSTMSHDQLLEMVLEDVGYTDMLRHDKHPKALTKLDNLKELSRGMTDFGSLEEYLDHISLMTENDTQVTDEKITLMTMHAAKGTEFDIVFLPGWEQGLFPHQRSINDSEGNGGGLEEERRLAYVALTRARKQAHISHVQNRFLHNKVHNYLPSWFLDELPQAHIINKHCNDYNQYAKNLDETHAISHTTSMQFNIGQRIFHTKYGYGYIQNIDRDKLAIDFEKAGPKLVLADYIQIA